VRVVPIGIDMPAFGPDGPRLDLPNRRSTAFLSVFDWNERKGADVLLRAWAFAFGPNDDVVLYVRTGVSSVGAASSLTEQIRALGLDATRMAPVEILDRPLPADAYASLFRSVDAFVLTSRGEAFCIPLLEAMASGLPAIGTGYGGSADFLDETTGFPIPVRLVPVARSLAERIPFYAGQRWADPSLDATVAALRRVVDDPAETERRAAAGFARAQAGFDRRRTAQAALRALQDDTPRRHTVRTAGRALLIAPVLADGRAGAAARGIFEALEQAGATPRVGIIGARDADLDPVAGRALRTATRLSPEPGEAVFAVDVADPDVRAVFVTSVPDDLTRLAQVERIWTDDPRIAQALHERGIARERLLTLRLPVDVTLWTPDARGPSLGARTILVAPEPARVDALTTFARIVEPSTDIILVLAPGKDAPIDARQFSAELREAMQRAGVANWAPRVLALPAPLASRHAIPSLATVLFALAGDALWPEHEYTRACGVPVVPSADVAQAKALLNDVLGRDAEGARTRRAAVSRARADAAALRSAYDEVASLAPVERAVRPLRIAAVLAPTVSNPTAVLAALRANALHEIVGGDGDLRGLDYVVRVGEAVETAVGWDEALVNALESRGVTIAESVDWDELAPSFGERRFADICESAMLARNSEAGTRAATPVGALQLLRAAEATASGPVWRCVACAVRRA
jgi:hypothetical protein